MNLDSVHTLFTKIILNWIINLNLKHKTIKFLDNNIDENIDNLGYCDDFIFLIFYYLFIYFNIFIGV